MPLLLVEAGSDAEVGEVLVRDLEDLHVKGDALLKGHLLAVNALLVVALKVGDALGLTGVLGSDHD